MSNNIKWVLNVEPHIADISDQIKNIQKELGGIQKIGDNISIGGNYVNDLNTIIKCLQDLQGEYSNTLKNFANSKIDTSQFDGFQKKFESTMDEFRVRLSGAEQDIAKFNQSLNSRQQNDQIVKKIENVNNKLNSFKKETKSSMDSFKEFKELIDVKKETKELEELDKVIKSFNKINIDNNKNNIKSNNVKELKDNLVDAYEKLEKLQSRLGTQKDPIALRNMQKRIVDTAVEVEQLSKRLVQLNGENSFADSKMHFSRGGKTFYLSSIAGELEHLKDISSPINKSLAETRSEMVETLKGLGQTAEQMVTTFQFKDGGIRIPVLLDEASIDKLKPDIIRLVDDLNSYSGQHPVEVQVRFGAFKGTKAEQGELNKALKNIQAQIVKIDDPQLKNDYSDLFQKMRSQFDKAAVLNIKTNLPETKQRITENINQIQQTLKEQHFKFYPEFDISQEEGDKIKAKLEALTKEFSLNITDSLATLAKEVNVMLDDKKVQSWASAFTKGLEEISTKITPLQTLLDSLEITKVDTKKNKKNETPDEKDVNLLITFTNALKDLQTVLADNNKAFSGTFDPLINAINNVVEQTKIIRLNLNQIQAIFSNVTDSGVANILSRIEAEIKNIKSIKVKIDGKIDPSTFISEIEGQINEPVKVPVVPLISSVNGFVETLQQALAENAIVVDVGNMQSTTTVENTNTKKKNKPKTTTSISSESNNAQSDIKNDTVALEDNTQEVNNNITAIQKLKNEYLETIKLISKYQKEYIKSNDETVKVLKEESEIRKKELEETLNANGLIYNEQKKNFIQSSKNADEIKSEYDAYKNLIQGAKDASKPAEQIASKTRKQKDHVAELNAELKKAEQYFNFIPEKVDASEKNFLKNITGSLVDKSKIKTKKDGSIINESSARFANNILELSKAYMNTGETSILKTIFDQTNASNESPGWKKVIIKKINEEFERIAPAVKQSMEEAKQELQNGVVSMGDIVKQASEPIKEASKDVGKSISEGVTDGIQENTKDLEKSFNKMLSFVDKNSFDQRTSKGKGNLANIIKQYSEYKEQGGSRSITDLTDNTKLQQRLQAEYERLTSAVDANKKAKQDNANTPVVKQEDIAKVEEETKKVNENTSAQANNQNVKSKREKILDAIKVEKDKGLIDFGEVSDGELQKIFDNVMEGVEKKRLGVQKATALFKETLENYKANLKEVEQPFSNKNNLSSGIEEQQDRLQSEIKETQDKYEELGQGTKRVISDIGLSYEEFIKKVKNDNSLEERFAIFDETGKVIDSFIGKLDRMNLPDEMNTTNAAKIFHKHSSISPLGGTLSEDDYLTWFDKFLSQGIGKQFELMWQGKTLNIDLSNVKNSLIASVVKSLVNISHIAGLELENENGEIPIPLSDLYNSLSNGLVQSIVTSKGGKVDTNIIDTLKNEQNNIDNLIKILNDFGKFRELNVNNDEAINNKIEEFKKILLFLKEHIDSTYEQVSSVLKFEKFMIRSTGSYGLNHNSMMMKSQSAHYLSTFLADSYSKLIGSEVDSSNFSPFSMSSDAERQYFEITGKYYDAVAEAMDYTIREALDKQISEEDFIKQAMTNVRGEIGSLDDDDFVKAFNNIQDTVESYIKELFNKYKVELPDLPQISNETPDSSNGKKQGKSYVEGMESEQPNAKQAGADLANAANEGTAEAQDSRSPSRVAEALGEMWGEGYAKGIKKHKGEVEDAVRELVNAGTLTAKEVQEEATKLNNGEYGNWYKDLKTPLNNIVSDMQSSKVESAKKKQSKTKVPYDDKYDPEQAKIRTREIENAIIAEISSYEVDGYIASIERFYDSHDDLAQALIKAERMVEDSSGKLVKQTQRLNIKYDKKGGVAYTSVAESDDYKSTDLAAEREKLRIEKERQNLYKQMRQNSEAKKKAEEGLQVSNVNNLLSEQKTAYQDVLNIRKQIAKLDPVKNTAEITELEAQKKTALAVYQEKTKELKAIDENANAEAQVNTLLEMRKKNLQEIAVIEARKLDKSNGGLAQSDSSEKQDKQALKKYVDTLKQYNNAMIEVKKYQLSGEQELERDAVSRAKMYEEQLQSMRQLNVEYEKSTDVIKENERAQNELGKIVAKNNQKNVNDQKKLEAAEDKRYKEQLRIEKDLQKWRRQNSAAESTYGTQFDEISEKLRSSATLTREELDGIILQIQTIQSNAYKAGQTGSSVFNMIKQRAKSMIATLTTFNSFYDVIRVVRQGYTYVADINKQMVELSKVSGQTLSQIQNDFEAYANTAKDLGATISDTISATADWSRLGYSVPDAKELARVALLYKNVGDGIDIGTANESLISTLQGYQMQADQAEHIVDVFNEVANNYAIDSAGIGEALQRSAASLNAANTSLEESVALVTAANTVVQNPEQVGTVFKTNFYVFMYSNVHMEYI